MTHTESPDFDRLAEAREIGAEARALKAENKLLRDLVQQLLDEDPNEPIADNGMTVLDGWRECARRALTSG